MIFFGFLKLQLIEFGEFGWQQFRAKTDNGGDEKHSIN